MPDEHAVTLMIRSAYLEGGRPSPPLTPSELRLMDHHRPLRRIGCKLPVLLVAAAVLIAVLVTGTPLRTKLHGTEPDRHARSGVASYSAYGLQVSIPRTWTVRAFPPCPVAASPGALDIGQTDLSYFCPRSLGPGSIVELYALTVPLAWTGKPPTRSSVNGIPVLRLASNDSTLWYVPSAHAELVGQGAGSKGVLGTLRRATEGATPAPGVGNGSEYLVALGRVPVSGAVKVESLTSGTTSVVQVVKGQFSFSGAPGQYRVTGSDGTAPCSPVRVTLISGRYSTVPPILCQGE